MGESFGMALAPLGDLPDELAPREEAAMAIASGLRSLPPDAAVNTLLIAMFLVARAAYPAQAQGLIMRACAESLVRVGRALDEIATGSAMSPVEGNA